MKPCATVVSTRGQVVIPEGVRKKLGLEKGDTLIVEVAEDRDTGAPQILLTKLADYLKRDNK